mmetsp:Transcript_125622/g.326169  ORF Transcript_125622/g.326169 Transcript_125622/m.326169 type:complete len:296 (+) Transcript_125622:1-888(+)
MEPTPYPTPGYATPVPPNGPGYATPVPMETTTYPTPGYATPVPPTGPGYATPKPMEPTPYPTPGYATPVPPNGPGYATPVPMETTTYPTPGYATPVPPTGPGYATPEPMETTTYPTPGYATPAPTNVPPRVPPEVTGFYPGTFCHFVGSVVTQPDNVRNFTATSVSTCASHCKEGEHCMGFIWAFVATQWNCHLLIVGPDESPDTIVAMPNATEHRYEGCFSYGRQPPIPEELSTTTETPPVPESSTTNGPSTTEPSQPHWPSWSGHHVCPLSKILTRHWHGLHLPFGHHIRRLR